MDKKAKQHYSMAQQYTELFMSECHEAKKNNRPVNQAIYKNVVELLASGLFYEESEDE